MKQTKKTVIFLVTALFFAVHFAFLFSYLLRPVSLSVAYTYPFFHQSWNLFAPPPQNNYHLYVSVPDTTAVSGLRTFNVSGEINSRHQQNRLRGYEQLSNALGNSIHYFEKECLENKMYEGEISENTSFSIIKKFVTNYMKSVNNINAENARLILYICPVNGAKPRVYYN
jgi:hypothetical protein